jgi:hypothetical protein
VNRSKFRDQEAFIGQQAKFKSYEMGMQVPFGMDSQVSEKRAIRGVEKIPWAKFQGPRIPKGVSDFGRAFEARPCPYADLDSPQVFRFAGSRLSQGEECHPNCPGIPWKEEEFHRATFLGQRVFCFHGWGG